MLSRTQLFHINLLKPNTLQEANSLCAIIEYTVIYHIKNSLLNGAYTISGIYCNRKDIFSIQEPYPYMVGDVEGEYRQLSHSIEQFIGNLVDSYYLLKVRKPNSILNIECCLINRNNISVSFDLY